MAHGAHGGGGSPTKPKVPPEMQAFLAARLGEQDLPELDAALEQESSANRLGALGQNLSRAASIYRGGQAGPMAVPKDNALRDFVLRKQAEAATRPEMTAPNPDDDPASAVSQAARAALLQTPHGRAVRDSLGETFDSLPASKLKPLLPMWRASADEKAPARVKAADEPPDEVDVAELTKRGIPAGLAKTHGEALDLIGRADAARAARDSRGEDDAARSKREAVGAGIDLRKEFKADPVYRTTSDMAAAVEKVRAAPDNGSGDLSLIYSYVKILDPGSVVREGEIALSREPTPLLSKLVTQYKKAAEGRLLHPSIRAEYKQAAEALWNAQVERYDATAETYRGLAREAGLDPKHVVPDFGFHSSAPKKKGGASDLISEAAEIERGGTVRVSYQGKTLDIPRARLAEALKDGAVEVK